MFSWLVKLYLLVRGDRFSRDKLEEIKDCLHSVKEEQNDKIYRLTIETSLIRETLNSHIREEFQNDNLLNSKINALQAVVELNNQFLQEMLLIFKKNA